MGRQFWTGLAFGALSFGASLGRFASSNCFCCSLRNSGFNGLFGFGYNSGFNGLCNRHIICGATPLDSFGVSTRTLSQLPLGYYV